MLLTETRNPRSTNIDALSTPDMLRVINEADAEIAQAVAARLPEIARVVDAVTERLASGGRLFYIGAGTSGRLGVLDASECPPTFNTRPELVVGIIAGGDSALRRSIEGAEDDPNQGAADLDRYQISSKDAVVGIAASGRTPYVMGALERARQVGALAVALSCVPDSAIGRVADLSIEVSAGPEVITGSTRMRAGTATKMVLNMISTGAMIRLGYVYGNLMVNVQPTNVKLTDRARRIIAEMAAVSYDEASRLLSAAGSVRTAILMHRHSVSREEAERLLSQHGGRLRDALSK